MRVQNTKSKTASEQPVHKPVGDSDVGASIRDIYSPNWQFLLPGLAVKS